MTREVVIWGCGGHAREVLDLCRQVGIEVVGFLDERPEMRGRIVDDVPVLGDLPDLGVAEKRTGFVCAGVGDPGLKRRFAARTQQAGLRVSDPIIHPAVRVPRGVTVGPGTMVCEGTVLSIALNLGAHVIINRLCTLGHDTSVGTFATIGPGVAVSGNVSIEEGAFIGTGSAIREKVRIGAWSVVAGGAFVTSDVPHHSMVAGVPAVVKKLLA